MKRKLVVGSRQSALALTQTNQVISHLRDIAGRAGYEVEFEVKKIVTQGDRIIDVTLSKVGGKGLFVKEIEQALLAEEIDLAVHSMKDVPSVMPDGLTLGAVPERVDPRDCIISRDGEGLDRLALGAVVGTSSLRRASQLQAYRPDVRIAMIRGNIDTRLGKLASGQFDAIMLAAAGLTRMGWLDKASELLDPQVCLPAVGQGALGIQCREQDGELLQLLALYHHKETALTVAAERAFLARLDGGCQVPIGAYATIEAASGELTLTGLVGSADGAAILKETRGGGEPEALGIAVAEALIARGADRILDEARSL